MVTVLAAQSIGARIEQAENDFMDSDDSLSLFIHQTRHIRLLSPNEEAALAWDVRCGQEARSTLDAMENPSPALLHELARTLTSAQKAREKLAEANVRLVISVARGFLWSGLPLADLVQEGNTGLMLAIDRFNPALGNRFSTYARWWIRQAVRRAVTKTSHTIRLPENVEMQRQRCYAARGNLQQTLEREPTPAEVSRLVALPLETVEWLLSYERGSISLNDLVGEDSELGDLIADTVTPDPEDAAAIVLLKETVEQALNQLPSREANILRLRFGLEDGVTWTIEQVASDYEVSKSRIRQLEAAALKRLCQSPYAEQLSLFLQN